MDSAEPTALRRKPCFIEGDYSPDFVAEMESRSSMNSHRQNYSLNSSAVYCKSMRSLSATPRSFRGRFFSDGFEEHEPHFLDACFLCKQPLSSNKDIFMYRGNIPFCSIECRQEQIDMDEAKEKNLNLCVSMKALRKKEQSKSSSPNKSSPNCPFRTGTLAAA